MSSRFYLDVDPEFMHKKHIIRYIELVQMPEESLGKGVFIIVTLFRGLYKLRFCERGVFQVFSLFNLSDQRFDIRDTGMIKEHDMVVGIGEVVFSA